MKRATLFNLLSVLMLGLTGVLIVGYLAVLVNPWVFFNPFPPPREPSLALGPTPTPSPTATPALPPTWTPTPSPSPTIPPSPTPTRTPTLTPSPTPTWPPTPTPTPRVTRAPYPFTCEVEYRMNLYGIPWSGVAGKVQDLDGNPLPGYHVAVECPGIGGAIDRVAGADPRYNLMYESEAAWEQCCDPTAYRQMEIRVRLYDKYPNPDGTYRPVSDVVIVQLGDWATRSLGFVTCTLNWEEWRRR
ncbi:MAG: hypothetical protein RMK65_12100 [Anaerolineae bacterium]|nr:hypothetical protein [Anaerolineae bacterium]MCX8068045.1 hypothetical protein [Anaerolineae bacterium]MDW7992830.1 hypothetical protein [Anaerolineae bacterium]